MQKLFEINFKGIEELQRLAEKQAELLRQNAESAVANTVLLGVARIANDCPVDTGRLQASVVGDLADVAGFAVLGEPQTVAEGKSQSVTGLNGLEGKIGTNVEYALYQEYGFSTRQSKNPKTVNKRINKRAGIRFRVRGKGFFRKNIPILKRHFNREMDKAIKATYEGRLLRKGE